MTNWEVPSAEDYARAFGEWNVWFEWGNATSDDPGKGDPPAWFARRASEPREVIPAIGLTETEFRHWLGGLMDEPRVEAIWRDLQPRIENTSLGLVLAPRPRR